MNAWSGAEAPSRDRYSGARAPIRGGPWMRPGDVLDFAWKQDGEMARVMVRRDARDASPPR